MLHGNIKASNFLFKDGKLKLSKMMIKTEFSYSGFIFSADFSLPNLLNPFLKSNVMLKMLLNANK